MAAPLVPAHSSLATPIGSFFVCYLTMSDLDDSMMISSRGDSGEQDAGAVSPQYQGWSPNRGSSGGWIDYSAPRPTLPPSAAAGVSQYVMYSDEPYTYLTFEKQSFQWFVFVMPIPHPVYGYASIRAWQQDAMSYWVYCHYQGWLQIWVYDESENRGQSYSEWVNAEPTSPQQQWPQSTQSMG